MLFTLSAQGITLLVDPYTQMAKRQIAQANHYTPTIGRLGELSQPTTVYDATGAPIGKLGR